MFVDSVSVRDDAALGGDDGAGVGVAPVVEAHHVAAQAVPQHAVHLHAVLPRPESKHVGLKSKVEICPRICQCVLMLHISCNNQYRVVLKFLDPPIWIPGSREALRELSTGLKSETTTFWGMVPFENTL